ncbi:SDR family NAD(P)-dependent oxidoreductase [Acidimangrovimonas sediminis]|uniref:SDR family NAD(P)-dependent oxidoreductase n=1 Tax=Acidimangrovimonas sediminis TaxID=2056283 RepID=UPI000C7F9382|nr:SDR family oxidoreductase [Acidimangrovimonas sediminis]
MSFSIAGKTAIVTGAAKGIGLAIARQFVEKGANVMFADMDESCLANELGDLPKEEGPVRMFGGDLRHKLTLQNLLSATIDAFDRVDILVNASRQMYAADPLSSEDDGVEALLEQNLMTSLRMSQMVAKRMIAQAEREGTGGNGATIGSIVNISSIAARRAQPELMAFSISSAAVDQMTRSLAVALAPKRIRVNGIAFGSVMSTSLKEALKDHPEMRDQIRSRTPLERIAPPGELCDAAQFLASDGAGFITGQVLTVDGGRCLVDAALAPVF